MGSPFEDAVEAFVDDCRDDVGTGGQLVIFSKGHLAADVAVGVDGLSRAVDSDSLMPVYCATKPLLAAAVTALAHDGRLDLEAALSAFLPEVRGTSLGRVSLRSLLAHRAGPWEFTAHRARMLAPSGRFDGLLHYDSDGPHTDAVYSEIGAWLLLSRVVELETGNPWEEAVRQDVIEPFGLGGMTYLGMSSSEYLEIRTRLRCNISFAGGHRYPLLSEVTEAVCTDRNPGFGGYSSMMGLAKFYEGVRCALDCSTSNGETLWKTLVTPQRSEEFDSALERVCSFSLGLMVDLAGHGFSRECSDESFGHAGLMGCTYAFCDPAFELAVAVHHCSVVNPLTSIGLRRPRVIDAIYRAVLERR